MKKKLLNALIAGVLACALILPAACDNSGTKPGGETPGGTEQPGGENPGGTQTETASLTFEKTEITLKVGKEEEVKFTAVKLEEISFESNKTNVATAALNAEKTALTVKAAGQGAAKITAKAGGKDLASLTVNVEQELKITAPQTAVTLDVEQKGATVKYELNDSSSSIQVAAASNNEQVVTVGTADLMRKEIPLTPVASGTAEVTITATKGDETSNVSVTVTVQDMYDTAKTDIFNFADDGNGGYTVSLKDKDGFIEDAANTELVIPSKYENKPITGIAANFLHDTEMNPALTTLYIPATVKTIGESAFEGCSLLTTVNIQKNSALETISAKAFGNCIALTSFSGLGNQDAKPDAVFDFGYLVSLRTIGDSAFYQTQFRTVYIPKSVTLIEDHAFAQPAGAQNGVALENVWFEDDDTPENAVSIITEWHDGTTDKPKAATDTPANQPFVTLNQFYYGAFTCNLALKTIHYSNIKFVASVTYGMCQAINDVYIDAATNPDAFKERGTNGTTQATGYVYFFAMSKDVVFTVDNEVLKTITIRDDLIGDSAGMFGCRGPATQGVMGCAGTVYVKDTLTPSDSFKGAYTQQDSSDKAGYTCWKLNA